ncbi:23S rRNA (guanosine-2'-O-)-methyltransferase RlmB [Candidatus Hartigia pinicola]|nr:23S rRNA (guanosine-2'-O-)-methyltransferase RlmB [Candidatus Hartigia pinicola]
MSEIIYGIHAVKSLLKHDISRLKKVYILKGCKNRRLMSIVNVIEGFGIVVQIVTRPWLDAQTAGAVHQGIIAKILPCQQYQEAILPHLLKNIKLPFLLILDCVTDPYNLGACLRSADAAGVHAVIVPKDKSAKLNSTVKKVACGAAESVPLIRVTNLARTLRFLKDYNIWIIGTEEKADNTLSQIQLTGPVAVVMGSEGKGLRRLTRQHCDDLIKIPMLGSSSSLNISVATGICLFEVVRQRAMN